MKRSAVRKYIHSIGAALACSPKEKRRILGMLKENIDGYFAEHPEANVCDMIENFGSPQDIADEFAGGDKFPLLESNRRRNKLIIISILCAALLAFIVGCISTYFIYYDTSCNSSVGTPVHQSDR